MSPRWLAAISAIVASAPRDPFSRRLAKPMSISPPIAPRPPPPPAAEGLADPLDLEQLPGHLDGVLALDLLRRIVIAVVRRGLRRRQPLQPLAVLDQVAAGLGVRPLLAREQRLVERDQRAH